MFCTWFAWNIALCAACFFFKKIRNVSNPFLDWFAGATSCRPKRDVQVPQSKRGRHSKRVARTQRRPRVSAALSDRRCDRKCKSQSRFYNNRKILVCNDERKNLVSSLGFAWRIRSIILPFASACPSCICISFVRSSVARLSVILSICSGELALLHLQVAYFRNPIWSVKFCCHKQFN